MIILGIETSCDETAISVLDASGEPESLKFNVLSNLILSQIKIHEKYGGVFPNLAKREHVKNIVPLLEASLKESGFLKEKSASNSANLAFEISQETLEKVQKVLAREEGLYENLIQLVSKIEKPAIDRIAVTYGPGLEPALWVGINCAEALALLWNIRVIPVNHMEGHICSVLLDLKSPIKFPAIALLVSGGHTELVHIEDWMKYKIIGQTKDDAVGEAFDKVARMLGLPYPGGPEISRLAEEERQTKKGSLKEESDVEHFHFPRPMLHSGNLDFSFSGLKTSVLYTIKKLPAITKSVRSKIAVAFEDAVIEVLIKKTETALESYEVKSLVIAGGVIANKRLRESFEKLVDSRQDIALYVPSSGLSGDNAVMIALCGYIRTVANKETNKETSLINNPNGQHIEMPKASGNLKL